MINRGWERFTGIMGIAAAALALGALFTWGNPQPTQPLSKITHYYVQSSHEVLLSQYLIVLFGLVAVVFATGLRAIVPRAEGDARILAPLILGGAIFNAAWMMVWAAVNIGLALEAAQTPAHTLWMIVGIQYAVDGLTGYSMALLPFAAGLAMVRGRMFARWIGWLGVVSGALCVIGEISALDPTANAGFFGAIGNLAFLGQLLFLVWLIATGVSLLRRSPAPTTEREEQRRAEPLPV